MPVPPTANQIRLNKIVTSLNAAVTTLDVISESMQTPFLQPIVNTLQSLMTAVVTVKRNENECTEMLEQIHELIYAVIWVHIKSDTAGELSPAMLHNLGKFTETLHKIHTYVEAEQEKSKIKQFFRQGEMRTLLKACHTGLEESLKVFKIQGATVLSEVANMQQHAQKTHQEVLELISALSDEASSKSGSSINRVLFSSHNSSNSFSLLPSHPKIFHGRELEVSVIMQQLNQLIPRVAILGGGGMGKTSLARAILHHPQITARYNQLRFFIACDAASNSVHLDALIGAQVGLQPGQDLTKPVVQYFSSGPPSLLILDNLETVWEPKESRANVEKLLALLEDIEHLALIITMRGAERPANVRWTHPFLKPLQPLGQDAARKTFIDIVDDGYPVEDIDKILLLADNMPLAIELIAHLVDYDGMDTVMQHWETERTSLLSEGPNKGSNLDLSISMSLESPRLALVPHSHDLLSLLSMLPDGVVDADLIQSKLPIENILACKAALLCTSLAYTDDQKRLKALVPIREYMQKMHPPMPSIVQPLLRYFIQLLEVYETYRGTASSPGIVARLTSNFANIQSVLVMGLKQDNPELVKTIYSICHFDRFSRLAGHGQFQLIPKIPNVWPHPRDHRLEAQVIMAMLSGYQDHPVRNAEALANQALECFSHFDDPDLKCRSYGVLAEYYYTVIHDIPRAISFAQDGLSLSMSTGNTSRKADMLTQLAQIKWGTGNYLAARENASESQRLAKVEGNLFREAHALHFESICWSVLGNYNQSILSATRARDLLRLCAMSGGKLDTFILNNQAEVHLLKSEYVDACRIHTQILHAAPIEQNPHGHAFALLTIAQIDVEVGAFRDKVHRNIDTAKEIFSHVAYAIEPTLCNMVTAALHLNEGDLPKATGLFKPCLRSVWGKYPEAISYCLERLGNASLWLAMDHASSNWTVIFLVHSLKLKQKLEIHKALQFLGDVCLAAGDQQTAVSLFTVALEAFTKMDVHRSRAECMLRLGDILELHGDISKAEKLWITARPLFERSSQTKQVGHIDERLARMSHLLEHHLEPIVQLSALKALATHPETADARSDSTKISQGWLIRKLAMWGKLGRLKKTSYDSHFITSFSPCMHWFPRCTGKLQVNKFQLKYCVGFSPDPRSDILRSNCNEDVIRIRYKEAQAGEISPDSTRRLADPVRVHPSIITNDQQLSASGSTPTVET
ncbi:hypothetical protein FB451DRAFT_1442001 [Mycena latifolia]|nr:hypothetical protein FB451DRAFT_1442001 [Mycena latifolia]